VKQDEEIENILRRYRPCGPPPALRARCIASPTPARWPYIAAAALLVVAAGTYRASATLQPTALRPANEASVEARLTAWLGGGPEAERAATAALARFRIDEAARRARGEGATDPDNERFAR
jgi:hypothetical protein